MSGAWAMAGLAAGNPRLVLVIYNCGHFLPACHMVDDIVEGWKSLGTYVMHYGSPGLRRRSPILVSRESCTTLQSVDTITTDR